MKLHCFDCGTETTKGALGLGENLELDKIFTWCPRCEDYPLDYLETKKKKYFKGIEFYIKQDLERYEK